MQLRVSTADWIEWKKESIHSKTGHMKQSRGQQKIKEIERIWEVYGKYGTLWIKLSSQGRKRKKNDKDENKSLWNLLDY